MRYKFLASAATGLVAVMPSMPAQAGETILYEAEAAWVDVSALPPADGSQGLPLRLYETQTRMEDGVVSTYGDIAFALDSPEALNALGTITLEWLPDKGDLTVHRVELVRDGAAIDLLAGGARFEILRREERLEDRILDGALTATMSVPGAEIGDVLRYSFTSSKDEQILADDMEFASIVQARPAPIAAGRMILSWPTDEAVTWRAYSVSPEVVSQDRDGYRFVTVSLPTEEAKEIPDDAPARFRIPPSIRATTFEDYTQISGVIAPYFATGGTIEPGGALAQKVAEIAGRTADPLERAALATQFVQDEIGYVLNGLNGGNYIPQSPAQTWAERTGDCKAKSLLLLAMLRELGLTAEAVLVHSDVGDAVPTLIPALGNFDHMIVRADIEGTPYWLDGTSAGLRLNNMIEVPRFRYALPLRDGGADLQEMEMRPQAIPDESVTIRIDQTAGIDLPAIYDITMRITGISAHGYEALSLVEDPEQTEELLTSAITEVVGEHRPTDLGVTFDRESGVATVTAHGLVTSPWDSSDARFELDLPYQVIDGFTFDVDRSRPEIADLPVEVRGPVYYRRNIEWLLPQDEGQFRLLGRGEFDEVIGGTRLVSEARLANGRLTVAEEVQSLEWEVPASDLPEIRRSSVRLKRGLPRLRAVGDVKRSFEYRGADRARLAPIEKMYAQLIAVAEPDDADAHTNRYTFRWFIGDFEGAREDMSAAIAIDATAYHHARRGDAAWQVGDLEGALADYETAARIDPDYLLYTTRLETLALLGRNDEAIALIDENAYMFEDPKDEAVARSYALGFSDRSDEGLALLRDELALEPDDASLLNALCWDSGVNDRVTEQTLDVCTRAVEAANNSAGAIDSRALALYRLGRYEEALRDLDVALAQAPNQHASRYLRGIVKRALGQEEAARADLALAMHASPGSARLYTAWGLLPK